MKERKQFNYAQRWMLEHSKEKNISKKRKRSIFFLSVLSFLLVAVLASPWLWQIKMSYELKNIEESIKNYNEVANTLKDIEKLNSKVTGMNRFVKTTEEHSKNPRAILSLITELLPAGTSVTSFSLQADKSVQIGIVVPGAVDVAKLWINFRDSGLFVNFDFQTVSLTDNTQNLSLTLKLK